MVLCVGVAVLASIARLRGDLMDSNKVIYMSA